LFEINILNVSGVRVRDRAW